MCFSRSDVRLISLAVATVVGAGVCFYGGIGGSIAPFVVSGIALAVLASLVGRSVEALGDKLGAGPTGVIQGMLGNLPELFVVLFSLKSKLYSVATAAIVGSVLANLLLVLGVALLAGGIRNGTQRFAAEAARRISMLLVLSVAALVVPSLTRVLHTPAATHERGLSVVVSILLLALFAASLPAALRGEASAPGEAPQPAADGGHGGHHGPGWPLWQAVTVLAVAALGAAFVSDWFVDGLTPAMDSLGISQAFAGLVIVAIAGNAVENVVGIQLAYRNRSDHALSVILQSPLQITLVIAPALVLLSPLVGASFTLVLSPLLLVTLVLAVAVAVVVVLDGESNWLEGAALLVLYGIIATAFWWG